MAQEDADGPVRPSLPRAVVAVSAVEGSGVEHLNQELRTLLDSSE